MYELTIRKRFAAAHRLESYPGDCCRLHGHTWEVEALVCGANLDENGMLVDFKILKKILESIVQKLDHCYLNELTNFQGTRNNPTAENIARFIYQQMKEQLAEKAENILLQKITVWESPDASASYIAE